MNPFESANDFDKIILVKEEIDIKIRRIINLYELKLTAEIKKKY
jgi:hypothetical protein